MSKQETNHVNKQLEEARRLNEQLTVDYYSKKKHYNTVKHNVVSHLLAQKAPVIKRNIRLAKKYATRKRSPREFINPNINEKKANQKIRKVKYQLYEMGFTAKALEELTYMFNKSDIKAVRMQAGFELGLWYANQYDKSQAKQAIHYLNPIIQKDKNNKRAERAKVLKAESLFLLGDRDEANQLIDEALKENVHADLLLAKASLQPNFSRQMVYINKALKQTGMKPLLGQKSQDQQDYNSLIDVTPDLPKKLYDQLATVIIPAYNSADTIYVAIESMLKQTYENLEVIIVDDCSQDETYEVAKQYEKKDSRVRVLQTKENSGPYVARNEALNLAKGDFITINDADDWSHPEKIETQVRHLIDHPNAVANTSEQARLTDDMTFYRRGKPGTYIFSNMSSLMFKKQALEQLGYWDSVRFGADGEFKTRLKLIFGKEAVIDLKSGPLSFQRQSSGSLTGSSAFGYPGFFMGARKEYKEAQTKYHEEQEDDLYYPYPMKLRPFPVPEPMKPERESKQQERRHFDVIIASDFRLLGGTNMSNIEEMKAQRQLGLTTGLVQLNRFDVTSSKQMNPQVRKQIDGEHVSMVVYGEQVSCDLLIVRHPPILEEWQRYVPEIEAKQLKVIVNQTPKHEYSEGARTLYDIKKTANRTKDYFGKKGIWYPIGPVMRDSLEKYHQEDLKYINLSKEDWLNIINLSEWQRPNRPNHDKIKIGRHSRDHYVKWPTDKEVLLSVYPETDPFEVHILGGAKSPVELLGYQPDNWTIYQFGKKDPKEFLKDLDVFLYYTHPDLMEAFGRVMFEAMSAGIPVILPPIYKPVFGEAAIYVEWYDVKKTIHQLMDDPDWYERQVQTAFQYVEKTFGYSLHHKRIAGALTDSEGI
ncbi:glycosyltransferase [Alkalibacillus silvisoli]|uniref:Glycosyltransferase 2-like domain-containing protein n=1 Tax=Alkalibacillus silvisoli TaxID=392823 RepID=A0ABN1A5W5_9BACI